MKNIKVTSLTKFMALLLLYEKPRHGYEIIKEVSTRLGNVSPSQIYPFLGVLEKQGYLHSGKRGAREKKSYRLTAKGNGFINAMFSKFGDILDVAVRSKLYTCSHCGCEVYKGVYKKKIKGRIRTFCCEPCARGY